jgi:hypothetical protein
MLLAKAIAFRRTSNARVDDGGARAVTMSYGKAKRDAASVSESAPRELRYCQSTETYYYQFPNALPQRRPTINPTSLRP